MIKYKQVYIDYFDYCVQDFIPCEVCGARSVDIHHLTPKGMGGSKTKDHIENLIAVCRSCHNKCHSDPRFNDRAKDLHLNRL